MAKPEAVDAHLMEVEETRQVVFQGNFLHIRRDTVRLPDASLATREFVVHPGAVMVVPVLDDGRLVMERQCRYPLGQVILEFPAGKLDPAESGAACAARELEEETGYRAAQWAKAGVMHNAPAYSTEGIEIWFARGLVAGPSRLDPGEFIEVVNCPVDFLEAEALAGRLTDAKTVVGLWWLRRWLSGEWSPEWVTAA